MGDGDPLQVHAPDGTGVARLVLDRAQRRNALSIQLRDRISDALDELAADDRTRVVVVTGRGGTFCSGFDLREFEVDDADHQARLWASSDRYHRTVLTYPLPMVAAVNGPAIAGGFDLALMCDLRVASSSAWFSHPERTFGDVVYSPLHDLVGGAVARELCLTGRRVAAVEAQALRLVSSVHSPDDLETAASALAATVAEAPRELLLRTKAKVLRRAGFDPESTTLDL